MDSLLECGVDWPLTFVVAGEAVAELDDLLVEFTLDVASVTDATELLPDNVFVSIANKRYGVLLKQEYLQSFLASLSTTLFCLNYFVFYFSGTYVCDFVCTLAWHQCLSICCVCL